MTDLKKCKNLGTVMIQKLNIIEVSNQEILTRLGAEKVFEKLYTIDDSICINHLYALEGAIEGIRWHNLSNIRKEELRLFFNQLKNH